MSHILLALETSGTRCGIALLQGDRHRAKVTVDHQDGTQQHAERLLPMVGALLAQAGLTQADIQAVAFGQGPGGFTGLRVACAVAQGMALALGIGVVPVGSLDAIAHEVERRTTPAVVAVLMDARMGEAYAALFLLKPSGGEGNAGDGGADAPILVQAPILLAAADLPAWLQDAHRQGQVALAEQALACDDCAWIVAGDGWATHGAALSLPAPWEIGAVERPSAQAVAQLAVQVLQDGGAVDPAQAQPLYVRDKVAFTTAERAGGLGGNPKAAAHAVSGAQS